MRESDLRTIAEVGRALWMDPSVSDQATLETVSATSLLHLDFDGKLERAVSSLLDRALRQGNAGNSLSNAPFLKQPFFRLAMEERLILVALHQGRWSYARVARVTGLASEVIAEKAWRARLELLSRLQMTRGKEGIPYPVGSQMTTPSCPVYDARNPWTQRFLDEEFQSGRERIFFQNHLMACQSCRKALNRCRDVYYLLERELPRILEDSAVIDHLRESISRSYRIRHPSERTVRESLAIFFKRNDVRLVLLILGLLMAWKVHQIL